MEISKEDKILTAGVEDKFSQCCRQYRMTNTGFLDLRQRSLVEKLCAKICGTEGDVRYMFCGGYEDAERTAVVFLPDYEEEPGRLFAVIRAIPVKGGKKPTHRDYLGSLTGLGIKREMIGDILVSDSSADIIVMNEIKDFILMNYDKAGRTGLYVKCVPLSELNVPEAAAVCVRDTVASLRLDNVISSAFGISRAKSAEAVRSGLVFVNNMQTEKIDMHVREGDKLVMRGKGKAYLREVTGQTKKSRHALIIERYV